MLSDLAPYQWLIAVLDSAQRDFVCYTNSLSIVLWVQWETNISKLAKRFRHIKKGDHRELNCVKHCRQEKGWRCIFNLDEITNVWWRAHNFTRLWLRRHSFSEKFLVTTVSRLVHPLLFIQSCSSTYKAQSLNTVMWLLVQEYWHVADSAELHSKKEYPMKTDLTSSQLL